MTESSNTVINENDPTSSATASRSRKRYLKRLAFLVLSIYLGVLLVLTLIQRKMIYQPTKTSAVVAKDWGFEEGRCVDLKLETDQAGFLHGWHVLPPFHSASNRKEQQAELDRGRPVILFFSGNARHRGYRADHFRSLTSLEADLFVFDYRGYAENHGTPGEKNFLSDARQIWSLLTEEYDIAPDRILLLGESLGGGVATGLASHLCESAEHEPPGGLFLKATFTSLVDVAVERFPWVPVQWVLFDRFPNHERIQHVTIPVTILHGRQDEIIPFSHARQLRQQAPEASAGGEPLTFVELPGIGHNDIEFNALDDYLEAVEERLQSIRQGNVTP